MQEGHTIFNLLRLNAKNILVILVIHTTNRNTDKQIKVKYQRVKLCSTIYQDVSERQFVLEMTISRELGS